MSPRGLRIESLALLGLVSLVALSAVACRTMRRVHVRPVADDASRAFAEARAAIDGRRELQASEPSEATPGQNPESPENFGGRQAARDRARALAFTALEAEPGWVGPARLLDDLDREELRGVEALSTRRRRLASEGESAGALYLAGRLEGAEGETRFERAADLDPGHAWPRHGLAWAAQRRGDLRTAIWHERAALARARDPWERVYFTSSLARFLAQAGRRTEALQLCAERLKETDSEPADRLGLELDALGIAMERIGSQESRDAVRRALDILREEDLAETEIEALVSRLRFATIVGKGSRLELSTALAARASPARDRLRAELMLDAGPTPLALGLLERARGAGRRTYDTGPLMRTARFAAGEPVRAVELWRAELPAILCDAEGFPRDPRLARIVRCARAVRGAVPSEEGADAWFDLAESLLSAGWFREARALAGTLARVDLDRALSVETRAVSGVQLLEGIDDMMAEVGTDRGSRSASVVQGNREGASDGGGEASSPSGPKRNVGHLRDLLVEMGSLFGRSSLTFHDEESGSKIAASDLGRSLPDSPRLDYGFAGVVVHPGPTFSAADESEGLGPAGEPVPGLARAMDALGRFALVGEMAGAGGPDGTILTRVLVEQRSGEHLGVPWGGTVAWCEGTDVQSRIERQGARVSAAALHEGYWLDVQSVRGELALFRSLAEEFARAPTRVEKALAESGLPLDSEGEDRRRGERRRIGTALGEASRIRLAVLRDMPRAREGDALGTMTLDRLALVTATHEEGHLTDRTRFLPLSKHWPRALGFLLESGFSPTRVAERLEYRAQLVALCDASDPRISLAQTLDSAETDGQGPTAHAAGYERLLEDLVGVLDEQLASKPGKYPEIDPDRTLVHQLHRLPAETIRSLSKMLARRKGMVE